MHSIYHLLVVGNPNNNNSINIISDRVLLQYCDLSLKYILDYHGRNECIHFTMKMRVCLYT